MTEDRYPDRTYAKMTNRPNQHWLREWFEDRTLAEMGIGFGIAAVAGFVLMMLAWIPVLALILGEGERRGTIGLLVMLGGFFLWIGLLAWLGRSLARIARGWGPERLGTPIFKRLQMGFLVAVVLSALGRGTLPEDLKILLGLLLVFDFVVVGMAVAFVLLAWSARCPMPGSLANLP